jgi:hypothetical protein
MSQSHYAGTAVSSATRGTVAVGRPAYQAYMILYAGFAALPVIAGLDKFANVLVSWEKYLAPLATQVVPVSATAFMMIVGVIEIAAGVLVAVRPRIGAYVVALWLVGIIINLLMLGSFYDVALRDFGLALGALALGRISSEFKAKPLGI